MALEPRAEEVLAALAQAGGHAQTRDLERMLGRGRTFVRRGLWALRACGFAERAPELRSGGHLWSLTAAGAAAGMALLPAPLPRGARGRFVASGLPRKVKARLRVPEKSLGGAERDKFGVVVTCRDEHGALRSLTAKGGVGDALRACCEQIDGWAGDWRIQAISTPITIMRDLEGSREAENSTRPEQILLGRIGRMDLLAR